MPAEGAALGAAAMVRETSRVFCLALLPAEGCIPSSPSASRLGEGGTEEERVLAFGLGRQEGAAAAHAVANCVNLQRGPPSQPLPA